MRMSRLAFIALLGAVGTVLRVLIAFQVGRSHALPWATLGVNVVGSLLVGVLASIGPDQLSPAWRAALSVGLLGAFTTYSTFALETLRMVEVGRLGSAIGYVAMTVGLGLLAVWLGAALGRAAA